MQKIESAARTALEMNRAINDHDIEALTSLLTEDCILEDHGPPPEGAIFRGKDEMIARWADLFALYPDLRIDIEDLSGFGDRCELRWKKRTSEGSPPLRGIDIIHVRGGRASLLLSYVKG